MNRDQYSVCLIGKTDHRGVAAERSTFARFLSNDLPIASGLFAVLVVCTIITSLNAVHATGSSRAPFRTRRSGPIHQCKFTQEGRLMKQTFPSKRFGGRKLFYAVLLGSALISSPAFSAEGIDADAEKILKSMSAYLGGLKSFSMDADIDLEILTKEGQKLQLSSYSTAVVERPSKLSITRKGLFADAAFIYDGKTLAVHGKKQNVYAQVEVPGTIDDAQYVVVNVN
jgi:hypothetical protein